MTRSTRSTRRGVTGLAALTAAAALVVAPTAATGHGPDVPATPGTSATAGSSSAAAPSRTRVVLRVRGCDGCTFRASSYYRVGTHVRVWSSRDLAPDERGRVRFSVRTDRTDGLSVAVRAPWERRTEAVSQLVFRYGGDRPGDRVTVADARSSRRGNVCYRGTQARRLVLGVRGYRAHFPGAGARATGVATFTTVAQPVTDVDHPVADGWSGAQDVPCFPS